MKQQLKIALFCHSLVSDWNHGNAHFLRGVASELLQRGHELRIYEGLLSRRVRAIPVERLQSAELVRPLLAGPGHAVWLCPTQGFRRAAFTSRGSLLQIAGKTSDPDRALANLLERDRMFTDRIREEATGLGLPVIDVDTTMTEDDLTGRVARAFGLG